MGKVATKKKVVAKKAAPSIDLADQVQTIAENVAAIADDVTLFESGNKAAGRRVRKRCQEIKRSCQFIRVEVQQRISEM